MNIVCIGSGNVAHYFCKEFSRKGHTILQIFSRSIKNAQKLATEIEGTFTDDIIALVDADLYLVCIKDDAIAECCAKLRIKDKLIVHTSGVKSLSEIQNKNVRKGVLYPVQTFSKNEHIEYNDVPICIETENPDDMEILLNLVNGFHHVYQIDTYKRKQIHLSGVFLNNFVNHLVHISQEICNEHQVPFEILLPIMETTMQNINAYKAKDIQTGPAKRGDDQSIKDHLNLIKKENYKEVYKAITKSILHEYGTYRKEL